jgi:membrane associated rhomboid family serine protease
MRRLGSSQLAFPNFRGATRRLILLNLGAYFVVLLLSVTSSSLFAWLLERSVFLPKAFLHGWLWQPLTYSFVHSPEAILGTLLELLSLWFLAGFLETYHSESWVLGLYGAAVLGTAAAGLAIYLAVQMVHGSLTIVPLYGCFGGIFGMLVAIGILYGDLDFMMFPLPISIKARYLAMIYGLLALAMLFTEQRMYAFAQLGGAAAGWLYLRAMPRRGVGFSLSEQWYGLRNRYFRWKRRRAARKFEVYMKSQGRKVRFDGQGRKIDDDHDDKSRWN